jgi:hypothetical protein
MDSGLVLRTPRNDDGYDKHTFAISPHDQREFC